MAEGSWWTARKSATLSIVVAWMGLVIGIVLIPMLIPVLKMIRVEGTIFDDEFILRAAGPLYACLAFGIAAVVILLRLLGDIRREEVFTQANVRRLRLISYCGFAIMVSSVLGAILAVPRPFFIILGLIAGFLGLLMRVVKNVIDAARLLKEDADYTI
ncbi:MAG: DUF2975 domain-containing protein [Propionibacteriaceae bacterium]|jgi:hypothetical protein|nr:DUF2975 domain-containing protein [Propionibacteriaceae bacterium]